MGTAFSIDLSKCCGTETKRNPEVQRDLDNEVKFPILQDQDSQEEANVTDQIHEDLLSYAQLNKKEPFISRRKKNERRTRSHDLQFPQPLMVRNMMGAKSDNMIFRISLTKQHRERLNRKRRSTIVMRRKKKDYNLPIRINKVWSIFTKYIIDESQDDDNVDIFGVEITYDQFNIILNNYEIHLPPDMPPVLIWELLNINGMITQETMALGLEKDELHNNPMKERGFQQKQFKFIFKSSIGYNMIACLMQKLNDDNVVSRTDKLSDPKNISYKRRNLVIWHKIIQHLLRSKPFNVEDDYLHGVLSDDVLNDLTRIIDILSSLDSHWKHRIQIMKYIDNQTPDSSASILTDLSTDSFIALLNAWSAQLKDSRSAVSKVAINLLPTVLSCLLLSVRFPAILFDESNIINPIYDGIFALAKNRRMKDLADDAYDAFVQVTDIFTEIATDLDDYGSLNMVVNTLEDHSKDKIEKHFKVREACVAGIGFVLFGVDNAMATINENEEDKNDKEINEKTIPKLSDKIQRRYLLQNEEFIASFGNIMENGVTDKNELCRKKAFQLLQKLETNSNQNLLQEIGSKWNYIITKKYNNYKKMEQRKNMKRQTPKRGSSKRKKGKKNKNKNSETENIVAP